MLKIAFILLISNFTSIIEPGEKKENVMLESVDIMVIDAITEEPVPAAQVEIENSEIKAYTDFDGLVKLTGISSGTYNIKISLISYQNAKLQDLLIDSQNNKILIKLQP